MADKSLNKTELVAAVASASGETQATVDRVLQAMFATLTDSVQKGIKVTVPGYLSVERTSRAARTGRNPQTGATIQIPAGHSVKISAGSKLKAAVK